MISPPFLGWLSLEYMALALLILLCSPLSFNVLFNSLLGVFDDELLHTIQTRLSIELFTEHRTWSPTLSHHHFTHFALQSPTIEAIESGVVVALGRFPIEVQGSQSGLLSRIVLVGFVVHAGFITLLADLFISQVRALRELLYQNLFITLLGKTHITDMFRVGTPFRQGSHVALLSLTRSHSHAEIDVLSIVFNVSLQKSHVILLLVQLEVQGQRIALKEDFSTKGEKLVTAIEVQEVLAE